MKWWTHHKKFAPLLFGLCTLFAVFTVVAFGDIACPRYAAADSSNSAYTPEACETKDVFGWIVCSISDAITSAIGSLIDAFLVPMLEWRMLL